MFGTGAVRRVSVILLVAFVSAAGFVGVVTPKPAQAGLYSPIPADSSSDPQDQFTDADALFAYVLSDIKGGTICVVAGSFTDFNGLGCEAEAWGGKNTVVGIGTQYVLVAGPYLKPGTWRLLSTNEDGEGTGLSEPFTVTPCEGDECVNTFDQEIVAQWKAKAAEHIVGAAATCLTFAAKDIKNLLTKAKGRVLGVDEHRQGLQGRSGVGCDDCDRRRGLRSWFRRHTFVEQPG